MTCTILREDYSGFVAGVTSIIGAAYFFDDEGSGSYYNYSSHDSDALDYNDIEYVEDIQEEQSSLPLHVENTEK